MCIELHNIYTSLYVCIQVYMYRGVTALFFCDSYFMYFFLDLTSGASFFFSIPALRRVMQGFHAAVTRSQLLAISHEPLAISDTNGFSTIQMRTALTALLSLYPPPLPPLSPILHLRPPSEQPERLFGLH